MGREILDALIPDSLQQKSWYDAFLLLSAQALAWSYLSDIGLLADKLDFKNDLQVGGTSCYQPFTSSYIERRIHEIELLRNDSIWKLSWSWNRDISVEVPGKEIDRLFNCLVIARNNNLLNYDDIPSALMNKRVNYREKLPSELLKLIKNFIDVQEGESLYLPGFIDFSLSSRIIGSQCTVYCETLLADAFICVCSLMSDNLKLVLADPIETPSFVSYGKLQLFDKGIGVLIKDYRYKINEIRDLYSRFDPMLLRQKEMLLIQHMLKQCVGDFVLVLPGIFLQKHTAIHIEFRKKLVEGGRLEGVIRLPSGLLPGRSQPLYLLIFRASSLGSLRLINADFEYFQAIPIQKRRGAKINLNHQDVIYEQYQDISNTKFATRVTKDNLSALDKYDNTMNNKFQLDPSVYIGLNSSLVIGNSTQSYQSLSDGFDIIRAQSIKVDEVRSGRQIKTFIEVTSRDINDAGLVDNPSRTLHVSGLALRRAQSQLLKSGDILLIIKGQAGRLGIVSEVCGSNWVAGQAFVILRKKPVNPLKNSVVLFRYLKSKSGKKLIDSICTKGGVPFIHSRDLKALPVPKWSELEQEQACRSHLEILKLYAKMKFFREKAKMIEQDTLKDSEVS